METEKVVESETSEAEKKAQKALIAAEKRKRAMEQMARMQRQFLKQNSSIIGDDSKDEEGRDDEYEDDETVGYIPCQFIARLLVQISDYSVVESELCSM